MPAGCRFFLSLPPTHSYQNSKSIVVCQDVALVHKEAKLVLVAVAAAGLDISSLWIVWQMAELYL